MKNVTTRERGLLDFLESIRRYQKLNQFIDRAYDTTLTLLEGHILLELEVGTEVTTSSLATTLQVNPMSISRAISRLIELEVVGRAKSNRDKRSSIISLLPKAQELISLYERNAERSIERLTKVLSPEESQSLRLGLFAIHEACGGVPPQERATEHSLRAPIRGITRALGLLELRLPFSPLNVVEWHILSELSLAERRVSTEELQNELHIGYERIGYALRTLVKSKRIQIQPSKTDARFSEYRITASGTAQITLTQQGFLNFAQQKIQSISTSSLTATASLLQKIVDSQCTSSLSIPRAKELIEAVDLSLARMIYARQLLSQESPQELFPARLCNEENKCVGVFLGRSMVAMAEFQKRSNTLLRKGFSPNCPAHLRTEILHLLHQVA